MGPGRWETQNNRVGSHEFVDHRLVEGTLRRSFALLEQLTPGFARAVYLMLAISEIHPFLDGNGRVARLMMNAELSAMGSCRIVTPPVFRNEYLAALRRASNDDADMGALVPVLGLAWRWTAAMPWPDRTATEGQLVATDALMNSTQAANEGIGLVVP